jgi:hypothetical protein
MELTPSEKRRLKTIVEQGSTVDSRLVLDSVESPRELWCLSLMHLWEFPADFLLFLENPECSLGHALAMYWSLNPGWTRKKSQLGRDLSDSEKQELEILKSIEDAVRDGCLKTSGIYFDPRKWIETRRLRHVEYVPEFMMVRASGEQVPHDLDWIENL